MKMSIKWWHIGLGAVGAYFLFKPKAVLGALTQDEVNKLVAAAQAKWGPATGLTGFAVVAVGPNSYKLTAVTTTAGGSVQTIDTGVVGSNYGELNAAIANAK